MTKNDELKASLLSLDKNQLNFERLALDVFQYQYNHCEVYNYYVKSLNRNIETIDRIEKIPFLPIEFFKTHKVISHHVDAQMVFESSGTTGLESSKHFVSDLPFYEFLSKKTFEKQYGPLTDYHVFGLLPSYLERNNSSLVYMVQNFIFHTYSTFSGFYLNNTEEMVENILKAAKSKRKILLIGVTFALLDLIENNDLISKLKNVAKKLVVMETGGMKGKRKELVREELHKNLSKGFGVEKIHSEYGMTELLSQAYSLGDGVFNVPNTMKILLREVNDPFSYHPSFAIGNYQETVSQRGKTGGINVVDLANIDSCAFIETKDLGSYTEDYQCFKVMGRFDHADLRGCNLMIN